MPVSFSELQCAFEFVSSGGMGENEAYLDRRPCRKCRLCRKPSKSLLSRALIRLRKAGVAA